MLLPDIQMGPKVRGYKVQLAEISGGGMKLKANHAALEFRSLRRLWLSPKARDRRLVRIS